MKKIIAFIVGVAIISIIPLVSKIKILAGVFLFPKIYFLETILPFFHIGYILTNFLIVLVAGFAVSFIDKKYNFLKLLSIFLVSQILGTIVVFTGTIDITRIILNLVLGLICINLGGLLYKKISKKNNEVQL